MTNKYEKPRPIYEYMRKLKNGNYGDIRIRKTSYSLTITVKGIEVLYFKELFKMAEHEVIEGPWFKDINRMCREFDSKEKKVTQDEVDTLATYKPYYKEDLS